MTQDKQKYFICDETITGALVLRTKKLLSDPLKTIFLEYSRYQTLQYIKNRICQRDEILNLKNLQNITEKLVRMIMVQYLIYYLGSVISVSKLKYFVQESSGVANVRLYRRGDTSKRDQVLCITHSGG